jgi:hypothetical protein
MPARPHDPPALASALPAPAAPRVAVLVPCFNEAATVAQVVRDFRAALPQATVYVYDNNSTDPTALVARQAGAVVRSEPRQGKGHVVRRMFADVEADVYVLVDGDGTYEAAAAPALVERLVADGLDLVNAARASASGAAFRPGHRLGNRALSGLVRRIFGRQFGDMLSGYKVLSRRFVKSFPAMATGFETETELAVHALELRMPAAEVATAYRERPEGSQSKLRTLADGWRILLLIGRLAKDERPLPVFAGIGVVLVLLAFALGLPVVAEFARTGLVPRLPTAVLAASLVVLGVLSAFAGLILDMATRTRQEMKRLIYLAIPRFEG